MLPRVGGVEYDDGVPRGHPPVREPRHRRGSFVARVASAGRAKEFFKNVRGPSSAAKKPQKRSRGRSLISSQQYRRPPGLTRGSEVRRRHSWVRTRCKAPPWRSLAARVHSVRRWSRTCCPEESTRFTFSLVTRRSRTRCGRAFPTPALNFSLVTCATPRALQARSWEPTMCSTRPRSSRCLRVSSSLTKRSRRM